MNELAAYTRRTFEGEAANRGVRFEVRADGDLPSVASGSGLLEQVMENLVSNAIKYTSEGGEVEVELTARGPEAVRIQVRDTGIGSPSGAQDKLFEEFFRASNAKKLTPAGSGLGLSLVKETVERHEGRMMLASEEGQGTTVVVDLPTQRD